MKNQDPADSFTSPGPGEHDIPDPTADVEGHSLLDQARLGIESAVPATPGSDSFLGNPTGTTGEFHDDKGPEEL
jgi:hypothetical protein